ncbi:MAG TPA: POTRA domain-containing protein [Steroidobacteraceae bacterium]
MTSIQVSGNVLFDAATLHSLVAATEGKSVTLQELATAVARISDYYHNHGYPLARAIIPAQIINAGVVRIAIIEARYGQIELANQSRVGDPLLQATLAALKSGQPVAQERLDHTLLLLSDIPGVAVVATLKPGEAVGTSNLEVATSATAAISALLSLDNDGNLHGARARRGHRQRHRSFASWRCLKPHGVVVRGHELRHCKLRVPP